MGRLTGWLQTPGTLTGETKVQQNQGLGQTLGILLYGLTDIRDFEGDADTNIREQENSDIQYISQYTS